MRIKRTGVTKVFNVVDSQQQAMS